MNWRLAFSSLFVFGLSLAVGRWTFAPESSVVAPEAPVAPSSEPIATAEVQQVSEPARVTPKNYNPIDRDLKVVDGGVKNANHHMTHFLASNYLEGVLHTAPGMRASIHWAPQGQELRYGSETRAKLSPAVPAKGQLVEKEGTKHFVYTSTHADTDERMHIRPEGGMEHDIILGKLPNGVESGMDLAYVGRLSMPKGMTIWDDSTQVTSALRTTKGLTFKDKHGTPVFYLRPPLAWDAEVTAADGTLDRVKQEDANYIKHATKCQYQLAFDERGGVELAVVTPGQWLSDSARSYPVTIDPNFGPFGLADGNPPIYNAVAGSATVQPAYAGGTRLQMLQTCGGGTDNRFDFILMPFNFDFYGPGATEQQTYAANTAQLFVYENGYANFNGNCNPEFNLAIGDFGTANDTFYPYWDDLVIGTQTGDRPSGIFFFVEGDAATGNRRLVIQWHRMRFFQGSSGEEISFNLILYECESRFQFIIGQSGETDRGSATVGVKRATNPNGSRYIQYEFNGGIIPDPTNPDNQDDISLISPGTSIEFNRSALSQIDVTVITATQGCKPLTACFLTTISPQTQSNCTSNDTLPPTIGYEWNWDDNTFSFTGPTLTVNSAEPKTQTICHTWVIPGNYEAVLTITDEFGVKTTIGPFPVQVCDIPDVVITAFPQGGYATLTTSLQCEAIGNVALNINNVSPMWRIERLGDQNQPGSGGVIAQVVGEDTQFRFDQPGFYRVTCSYSGTDNVTSLPTVGSAIVYIFVQSPTTPIVDGLMITASKVNLDWVGKRDGPDPDGLPPNTGSSTPGVGLPDRPDNDTVSLEGYISLPGVSLSALTGRRVRVTLNGAENIFDGIFDAAGKAVQGGGSAKTGEFNISLPAGVFRCNVKRDLHVLLGVTDATQRFLLPAHYRVDIDGLFPPVGFDGAIISYDYRSTGYLPGPPATGSAEGIYKFGAFANYGTSSFRPIGQNPDVGTPSGQTLLLSGGFMVTDANIKLNGGFATLDLRGLLARFGGDDLLPRDDSDVVVGLGAFSESLNFTTTGGFKAKGKAPSQSFNFKRPKTLGKVGIQSLSWKNRAGDFRIKSYPIANEQIGINPDLTSQILQLSLTITPESTQQFVGITRFEVLKKSATNYIKSSKAKKR